MAIRVAIRFNFLVKLLARSNWVNKNAMHVEAVQLVHHSTGHQILAFVLKLSLVNLDIDMMPIQELASSITHRLQLLEAPTKVIQHKGFQDLVVNVTRT